MLFRSEANGRPEIFVQPFPTTGGKWQISTNGGGQPRWRQDGKELYYLGSDRKLMSVSVNTEGTTLKFGTPIALFDTRAATNTGLSTVYVPYAVAQNGQRFLVAVATREAESVPVTVLVNWTAKFKK